ncbi:MAG: cytochrome c oxidase assembly protein [Acidimicrobiales bacterium]
MAILADLVSPPVRWAHLLGSWQTEPLSLLAMAGEVATAALYLAGVRRLSQRGRRWSRWRSASFLLGLLTVLIATGSGLAYYDDSVFAVHVIQHLVLMTVAPALLALGAPVTLAVQAAKRPTQRRILAVIHSGPVKVITFPVLVWLSYYATMFVYFFSPLYGLSLRHPLFHDYTHLHFLVAGLLFWVPIVGLDPSRWQLPFPARILFLFTGLPFDAFLGIAIMGMTKTIDPAHTLADTHAGGAIFWAGSELLSIIGLTIIIAQWARADERQASRDDRRLDRAAGYIVKDEEDEGVHAPGAPIHAPVPTADTRTTREAAWEAAWAAKGSLRPTQSPERP